MGDVFLLSEHQMARIMSGIVYVINGLRWKGAPAGYGPHKTLYNRFIRWNRLGVFDRIFAGLVGEGPKPERIMTGEQEVG
nr:transposase [Mesorhizobium sp. LCM 4576]